MIKKTKILLLSVVLCVIAGITAYAEEGPKEDAHPSRVYDEADILTDAEESVLLEKLDAVSRKHEFDVAVAAVSSAGGKEIEASADDFYDFNGYGMGEDYRGILLFLDMETRKCHITTTGYGLHVFTDAGLEYMMERILEDLKENDYEAAFIVFGDLSDDFLTQAENGEPYDTSNLPKAPFSAVWIFVSILAGAGIAAIYTYILARGMKSVRSQENAVGYLDRNSIRVQNSRDIFLYRNVTRTLRQKNESSGGSSTHTSSSGRVHGGRSGSF